MASTSGVNLAVSGLASGFDWQTLVTQLAQAERAPETVWSKTQSKLNSQNSAYTIIKSYLSQLQNDVQALKDPALYDNRSAQSASSSVATAASASGGLTGSFKFNISTLATAATQTGTGNISSFISPDGNVGDVTVGSANFAAAVTAGTFTVNGAQVNIATTDSLQTVFDNIAAATNNAVTASYDNTTDKITLSSVGAITLGSAADTSNFLQVAKLYNTGSGTVTSLDKLGRVNTDATLASADLAAPIAGTGSFAINGVSFSYDAGQDTVQSMLDQINSSAAGVSASYDVTNNHFVLANKTTGDVGIALQDVTGNFLGATGLSGGALTHGKNLLYTLNGSSQQLISQGNTITQESSSLTGVTVTALATGTVSVTVGSDNASIKTAVQNFINDYNTVQSYIGSQTASSTDSTGSVTSGILASDQDANGIIANLRSLSFAPVAGLTGALDQLAKLGIQTNGKDNTIQLSDATALDTALANNLNAVKNIFSDATNGVAVKLDAYLTKTIGDNGTIIKHQASLTKQSTSIDDQIANQEKIITADAAAWTKSFRLMETAQASLTQQLAYLNKAFP